jgi:glycosyltransferase involved in cell wall biosynthesis
MQASTLRGATGPEVYEIEWPNDFAAARNWALDRTRADWILYIDADEHVAEPRPADCAKCLRIRTWPVAM